MGRVHYSAATTLGADVVGIVDPVKPQHVEESFSGKFYDSIHDVPSDIDVNFCVIATPTDSHFRTLMTACDRLPYLEAILLEKPAVLTPTEAVALKTHRADMPPIFVGEVEHYNLAFADFDQSTIEPRSVHLDRDVALDYFLHGDRSAWFLDKDRSGGIVLDATIHDINLVVGKFGVPLAVELIRSSATEFDQPDEVEVQLRYASFNATVRTSWVSTNLATPISVAIRMTDERGDAHLWRCDDYLRTDTAANNPYVLQMGAFLSSMDTGTFLRPLDVYLNALDVAFAINDQLGRSNGLTR